MPDKNAKNPWTTLSGEVKYENKWIKVTEYQVINPGGGPGIYGKIHYKNIGIGILPLDEDDNTWLVGQYRYTLNEFHWELPEGGGPLHEDSLEAAKRELKEETGITAKRWTRLLTVNPSNSTTDEVGILYLAEELSFGHSALEETEADLKLRKISLRDAIAMVDSGEITDTLTMLGLMKMARLRGI
jgi:8-oxo-dGTP pyrophosphatase MutT (NUDIX family)